MSNQQPDRVDFRTFENGAAHVTVDAQIYSLQAIKKAIHQCTRKSHVHLELLPNGLYLVRLIPKHCSTSEEALRMVGEFCNLLLDFDLREAIFQQTEAVRNLILANAFSQSSLVEPELESADYRLDPNNIGIQDKSRAG